MAGRIRAAGHAARVVVDDADNCSSEALHGRGPMDLRTDARARTLLKLAAGGLGDGAQRGGAGVVR